MTITACPVALNGMGKCSDAQCRLRHDVVHCKPCKCFVLHGELATHRRREDHRLKCGFGKWKAEARQPAPSIPHTYILNPKPSKKLARRLARKELARAGSVTARGGEVEMRHLSVSGEEGLEFKSEVGAHTDKKKKCTVPVTILKTADGVSLTLVDVVVTAGSWG